MLWCYIRYSTFFILPWFLFNLAWHLGIASIFGLLALMQNHIKIDKIIPLPCLFFFIRLQIRQVFSIVSEWRRLLIASVTSNILNTLFSVIVDDTSRHLLDQSLHEIQSPSTSNTIDTVSVDSSIDYLDDADREKDVFRTKVIHLYRNNLSPKFGWNREDLLLKLR